MAQYLFIDVYVILWIQECIENFEVKKVWRATVDAPSDRLSHVEITHCFDFLLETRILRGTVQKIEDI